MRRVESMSVERLRTYIRTHKAFLWYLLHKRVAAMRNCTVRSELVYARMRIASGD